MVRTTKNILLLYLMLKGIDTYAASNQKHSVSCQNEISISPIKSLVKDLENSVTNSEASLKNEDSVKNTVWMFAKSKEKGFEIYIPLIQKTIGNDANYNSAEFANALKNWQIKNGCKNQNGILDVDTFLHFKDIWQSSRKIKSAFKETESVSISRKDLYDSKREPSLSKIGGKTYLAYQAMITAAKQDGLNESDLKIVASNRTLARLKMLQKSNLSSKAGVSLASKNSVHFTGRALDLFVGGDPVNSDDANRLKQTKSKAYLWLLKHGEEFGFKNYFYEPWHWEFVGY